MNPSASRRRVSPTTRCRRSRICTRASWFLVVVLGFAIASAGTAHAQDRHRGILRAKFETELQRIASDFNGVLGIQVVDLAEGDRIGVNEALPFPQGSAIKVAVLLELFHQARERPALLREHRTVTTDQQVGGSGIIRYFGDGTSSPSIEDLAVLMIVLSDNTATNMLIEEVGMGAVNETLRRLGFTETRLQREMMRSAASARGDENLSTPAEAAELMVRIENCEIPVSAQGCERIRDILRIPKDDPMRDAISPDVPVAFKSGWIEGVRALWAFVDLPDRPYVLTVMTNYAGDAIEKDEVIRRVSKATYAYFSRLARSTPYGARVSLELTREPR